MNQKQINIFSLFIILLAIVGFVYLFAKAYNKVSTSHLGTANGTYVNMVKITPELTQKTLALTSGCSDDYCKAQRVLDFVTTIPYAINNYETHNPDSTISRNTGDCDDKSNLLISMLKILGIESYFVLVPNHIFVISKIDDHRLRGTDGIYINGAKYTILESTATKSPIGFPLKYKISEIEAIIEPFSNQKIDISNIEYRK